LINDKIPFVKVHLANSETNKLGPLVSLDSLLDSLKDPVGTIGEDGKKIKSPTHFIQLVSLDPPVVRLVNRADAYAKKKERAKSQKLSAKQNVTKEIQLTWGVAQGDWEHKVSKARSELKKGNRVDVVFAPKSKVKPPSHEEMLAIANKMVESLRDVGYQWKDIKKTNSMLLLHLRASDDSTPSDEAESSQSPS
jgi:translation initiation factor IF-3